MRRPGRLIAAGIILAAIVMSGFVVGPRPEPARAGLASVGVNDSLTMKHDRVAVVAAPGVLGNDLNLLGGTSAILVSGVTHGTLSLRSDGGYTYSPSPGYVGADRFTYRPSGLLSTPANVVITVTNATPVAHPDAYSGAADSMLVVASPGVLANDTDADGDALTAQLVGGIPGSLNLNANGGFTYMPGGGFSGTATFSYRVWDGVAWSGATTASLTISGPTPIPTPASTSTPVPTPMPTATVLPLPTLPIPPIPLPTPILPLPSISLPLAASPTPTSSPSSSGAQSGPASSGSGDPSGSAPPAGAATGTGVRLDLNGLDLGLGSVGLQGGLLAGLEVWAVPAAVIGGPGLLVLLWIALQAAGALVWVPAARRLRDGKAKKPARPRAGS